MSGFLFLIIRCGFCVLSVFEPMLYGLEMEDLFCVKLINIYVCGRRSFQSDSHSSYSEHCIVH